MICNIPQTETWISHLSDRANEAKELGLLAGNDELTLSSTVVFYPDGIEEGSMGKVQPDCPIREIQGIDKSPGWVKRDDLFDEAALWICEKYCSSERVELFCEAGYSEIGDKVLESRQHVIYGEKPLLNQKLSKTSSEVIAQTLRWGRSWRLLGVVADMPSNQGFDGINENHLLFICDALDGDSILAAEIGKK